MGRLLSRVYCELGWNIAFCAAYVFSNAHSSSIYFTQTGSSLFGQEIESGICFLPEILVFVVFDKAEVYALWH